MLSNNSHLETFKNDRQILVQ